MSNRTHWLFALACLLVAFAWPQPVEAQRSVRRAKPTASKRNAVKHDARKVVRQSRQTRSRVSRRASLNKPKKTSPSSTQKRLKQAGISDKNMERVLSHVALGMPRAASRKSPENFLLARNQYVLSYSKTRKTPNWVSWSLRASDMSGVSRKEAFRADSSIPKSWSRATHQDYSGSGFTRGHLVASSERLSSKRENSKTFVFTNIVPQSQANNGGPWLHLENFCKDQVMSHNMEVFIIAGGLYEGAPKTIGTNKVAVPSATWKVAVLVERGKGLKGVNAATRVVSIVVPNEVGAVSIKQPFTDFRVTPREIQKRAGVELFAHLPPMLRSKLLDSLDVELVPKGFKQPKQKNASLH